MQITYTGHGFDITPALKDFTAAKLVKLSRHSDHINRVNIIFDIQNLDQIAEATIHLKGTEIFASASADDMYHAIEGLVSKLDKQLIKYKEKHTERR